MDCDEGLILLSAQLDGELSGFEQRSLRDHLEGCASCRTASEELQAVQSEVRRLPTPSAPPELWPRVVSVLAQRRAEPGLWDTVMTARGRVLVEKKGDVLWPSPRMSHLVYRLHN